MDERMVDRPHDDGLRAVVGEAGERQPKRSRLLTFGVRIHYGPRRSGHVDARRHDGEDRAQVRFGSDPNDRVEKALPRWKARVRLRLAEARALPGGKDGARDWNLPNGDGPCPDVVR